MSKSRTSKKKGKPRSKPAETSSFALSPGWVAAETLLVPGLTLLLVFFALARFADVGSAGFQIAIVAVFVAIRLPLLVFTLTRDRRILLGKDELRVPVVGVLQLRAWTIPFEDVTSIGETKKGGGSSKIVIGVRGGRTRRFAASVVRERAALIKAIERRASGADPG